MPAGLVKIMRYSFLHTHNNPTWIIAAWHWNLARIVVSTGSTGSTVLLLLCIKYLDRHLDRHLRLLADLRNPQLFQKKRVISPFWGQPQGLLSNGYPSGSFYKENLLFPESLLYKIYKRGCIDSSACWDLLAASTPGSTIGYARRSIYI